MVLGISRLHRHSRLRACYRVLDTQASEAAAELEGRIRASRAVVLLGILRVPWRLAVVCSMSLQKQDILFKIVLLAGWGSFEYIGMWFVVKELDPLRS
jgi:hypothetical protein